MGQRKQSLENLEALKRFWRRSPFHDERIEEMIAVNRRVVIRLARMSLVITEVTNLKRCELPALWLYDSITTTGGEFVLDVETDRGDFKVKGKDIRLIRNHDLAVLIPPIDAS